ncbi:MAG: hypothetical protein IT349_19335 [Candidatus Eisenbacteria bacterium]|nr:hypothetical protein [Candidatus Eisenbacteria bacterium]
MGKRLLSLGAPATGSNNGITVTGSTNAKPIVVTIGAGHGLIDGDRIRITGITGNTNANGDWTLSGVSATTAQLVGSSGNDTHGGTAVVSVICDRTPFMAGKAATVHFGALWTAGTLLVQGSDDGTTFSTLLTETTAQGGLVREVTLKRYMKVQGSASTGAGAVNLVASH